MSSLYYLPSAQIRINKIGDFIWTSMFIANVYEQKRYAKNDIKVTNLHILPKVWCLGINGIITT